jgi:hypothetical protein
MSMRNRLQSWDRFTQAEQEKRDRIAFLLRPVVHGELNPPHLTRPVKLRVTKAFMAHGRRQEVGTIVTLPASDAHDAVALHRAEWVEE